jgi:hypothetical protein
MRETVEEVITATQDKGGEVYMDDPRNYSESHLQWLREQTGLTRQIWSLSAESTSFSVRID